MYKSKVDEKSHKSRSVVARYVAATRAAVENGGLVSKIKWSLAAAILSFGTPANAGAILVTLHSFTGGADGGDPRAPLIQAANGDFYGTTYGGGTNTNGGFGTVFDISADGVFGSLHSFAGGTDGAGPSAALVQAGDDSIYGTTSLDGTTPPGSGTVFKITPAGTLTDFCPSIGGNGAGGSDAWLTLGSDGNLYAVTLAGGTHYAGSVCRIDAGGLVTTLHSFDGDDGEYPDAPLTLASDGYFYGTTQAGGTNNGRGTVFKISTNGDFTSLHSAGTNEGQDLEAPLVQGRDGYLYGTATGGGAPPVPGTVFKISTNGALTTLYTFTGGDSGGGPGPLTLASDGYFYGVSAGGAYSVGTVFQISTSGTLTTLYTFSGGSDGSGPEGGLVQGNDGSFYGTTAYGGQTGDGTVFRLSILPEFQSETLTNGALNLTWSTEAGGIYQLQYTSDVTSSNWTNLGSATVATGSSLSGTDFVTNNAQRFYRVALVQ